MKCIVIDDEPLAREGIIDLAANFKELEITAFFNNASKASKFLLDNKVDLIFLDIEMPGINGLDFAKSLPKSTLIIFITAYKEYAVDSYELEAIDYLLKPVLLFRFEKAVKKALQFHKLLNSEHGTVENISQDFIFIKADRKFYKIHFDKILFIEGLKDYVVIHTVNNKVVTSMNLKTIHDKLPDNMFIRVSKSYIVNEGAIEAFDNHNIYIGDNEIPLGKMYQENFQQKYLKDH